MLGLQCTPSSSAGGCRFKLWPGFPCAVCHRCCCSLFDQITVCSHLDVSVVACYLMPGRSDWLSAVCVLPAAAQSRPITRAVLIVHADICSWNTPQGFNRHLPTLVFLKQPVLSQAGLWLANGITTTEMKKETTLLFSNKQQHVQDLFLRFKWTSVTDEALSCSPQCDAAYHVCM